MYSMQILYILNSLTVYSLVYRLVAFVRVKKVQFYSCLNLLHTTNLKNLFLWSPLSCLPPQNLAFSTSQQTTTACNFSAVFLPNCRLILMLKYIFLFSLYLSIAYTLHSTPLSFNITEDTIV